MKKIQILTILLCSFFAFSCTTATTDKSYEMGAKRQFDMTLKYVASKDALKEATIEALTVKKWSLQREGDAIRAKIDHRGVSARLYITFAEDTININSEGSNINGKPIVPLRLIDNLNSVIKKRLVN